MFFTAVDLLFHNLFHVTADQPQLKPKSEKDKLKEKYPALCQPDAPLWTVNPI